MTATVLAQTSSFFARSISDNAVQFTKLLANPDFAALARGTATLTASASGASSAAWTTAQARLNSRRQTTAATCPGEPPVRIIREILYLCNDICKTLKLDLCLGGSTCCSSLGRPCQVGEGGCSGDSDCSPGLECGDPGQCVGPGFGPSDRCCQSAIPSELQANISSTILPTFNYSFHRRPLPGRRRLLHLLPALP